MNTQKFKDNGHSKFPVSTGTLDFMQEQIKLVYGLAGLAGVNMIVRESSINDDGLVIVDGELMPLKGSKNTYINVIDNKSDITFKGETIKDARTERYAIYSSTAGTPASDFSTVKSLKDLEDELADAKRHHTPKGTVIDWYGEASCESIPYGWIPCGGFYPKDHPKYCNLEVNKWKERYNVNIEVHCENLGPIYYVRIYNVGNIEIPNLAGRFIVGAGYNKEQNHTAAYSPNETGGADSVKLTASQSGLPTHSHNINSGTQVGRVLQVNDSHHDHGTGNASTCLQEITLSINNNASQNASQAHENRPPYYALYKLIKVI